jgi:hypothetical protein
MMIGYDIYDCFTMEHFRLRQKMTLTTKIYCSRLYDLRNDILFATMWLWVWAQRPRRLSVCLYLIYRIATKYGNSSISREWFLGNP